MSKFYSLKVLEIESLTAESVKIVFDISKAEMFSFKAGQYITLRKEINNDDVRRSYSLSSAPDNGIEIGVKRIENGLMSSFLTKELKVGDSIDVMPPTGNFYLSPNDKKSHYVAICAIEYLAKAINKVALAPKSTTRPAMMTSYLHILR